MTQIFSLDNRWVFLYNEIKKEADAIVEKILIVEDDESILNELILLLRTHGYLPVLSPPCDLALVDVNLPTESGFFVCRKLKESNPALPVLFLTARDSVEDELTGFGVGGDDYIKKPYNPTVLLARIARFLKKSDQLLVARELTLDPAALTMHFRCNSASLTKNEMLILTCLMQKPVCSRNELIEDLWAKGYYLDDNTLYVNISRLRGKLKDLGAEGYLETVRGVGYRL